MPRDAKRMKPELMWGLVDGQNLLTTFPLWRRTVMAEIQRRLCPGCRLVRVRVTQYKPRKRHAT